MRPEIRYAKQGDVSLAYQVVGDGPFDLVLVPGFVSHLELLWDEPTAVRFIERLASFSRLILWDKRGQGLSDRLGVAPTLEQSMDDLGAVLDAAGSEQAALFGCSEGGPVSILFAASHPDRVRALVLYGSFAKLGRAPDYPVGAPERIIEMFGGLLEAEWGGPAGILLFAPSMADNPRFRGSWARLLRSGTSPRGIRNLLKMCSEIDVRDVLPAVGVPTLVLHRRDDRISLVGQGRYLAEHIPRARYVELAGGDDLPFAGDTDAVLDEVEEFLTGALHEREGDRILATVMFTDIVGSTERAARLGDRGWRDLVESHDALVRRQLERFRGREIKTIGDGFLVIFDGPNRAIRCAREIVDGATELGIEIRAGVHSGECEVRGEDVGGMAVNIGARVAAEAGPGEVLVSSTVKDLVVGSGTVFEDRGTRRLKGVPDEWHLFAVGG